MLLMPQRLSAGEEGKALLIDGSPNGDVVLASRMSRYFTGS